VRLHRTPRRGIVALVALAVVVGLAASPALASVSQREFSTKVKVKGKALKPSDAIGSADDPAIGKTPPSLTGQGFDGQRVVVANDGKPRAIVFLAHWCPHCQREVPLIVDLAKQGKLDGLEVDAVTTSTSENYPNYPPSKWLKREHWPFSPVLADDHKFRAFTAFGGRAFPYFVLVGADGKVAGRAEGEASSADIIQAVSRLLAGQPIYQ
jgi:cytochrome c biogenesis protein CcmG, thiol:disulfide interchange protein DsbE